MQVHDKASPDMCKILIGNMKFFEFLLLPIDSFERIVRYMRRKVLVSKLAAFGKGSFINRGWAIPRPENIFIGKDVSIGEGCRLSATNSRIIIKDYSVFGPGVSIHGGNHRTDIVGLTIRSVKESEKRPGIDDADVVVEEDVWIGERAIIMKGVTLGRGCVVGAGSIITKSTLPYSINVGHNRQVGMRFTPDQIKVHEKKIGLEKVL